MRGLMGRRVRAPLRLIIERCRDGLMVEPLLLPFLLLVQR